HYERIWRNRNPVAEGEPLPEPDTNQLRLIEQEEHDKIQRYVAQLLPSSAGVADLEPLVKVTTFEHVAAGPRPAETTVDAGLAWLGQNWSSVGMMLLGLVSLFLLRSMVRGAAEPPSQPSPKLNIVK